MVKERGRNRGGDKERESERGVNHCGLTVPECTRLVSSETTQGGGRQLYYQPNRSFSSHPERKLVPAGDSQWGGISMNVNRKLATSQTRLVFMF